MTRWLLAPLLALLLMGQDCEPEPGIPEGGTAYCHGLEYTVWDKVVGGVKGAYDAIIDGEVSTNRRATVQVFFGQSYCSGVALSPHTILTAAHCGYSPGLEHRIRIEGQSTFIISDESVYHPDYQEWIDAAAGTASDTFDSGGVLFDAATGEKYAGIAAEAAPSAQSREGRKSDLMLLFTDEAIPPPYIPLTRLYSNVQADKCYGLIAQGYGRAEVPKPTEELRESKYKITTETEKLIHSRFTDVGKICYGDSGGPLYADVGPGTLELAGITTTTMSSDCLQGGSHVRALHYKPWLQANGRP